MFDIFEVIDLEPIYGEAWKGCFLKFRLVQMGELSKLSTMSAGTDENAMNEMIKLLEDKFVEGKGIRDGVKVDVVKKDISTFPVNLMQYVVDHLTTGISKKKLNPTTTTSEAPEVPAPPQS